MAEDSEVDSIPSNECKKVNDLSALGRGTPELKAWHQSTMIFPQLASWCLAFCGWQWQMWVTRGVFNTISKLSSASDMGSLLCLGKLNFQPYEGEMQQDLLRGNHLSEERSRLPNWSWLWRLQENLCIALSPALAFCHRSFTLKLCKCWGSPHYHLVGSKSS